MWRRLRCDDPPLLLSLHPRRHINQAQKTRRDTAKQKEEDLLLHKQMQTRVNTDGTAMASHGMIPCNVCTRTVESAMESSLRPH